MMCVHFSLQTTVTRISVPGDLETDCIGDLTTASHGGSKSPHEGTYREIGVRETGLFDTCPCQMRHLNKLKL